MIKTIKKFSAEWCGPCKVYNPVLDAFAADHPEIAVEHVDVDNDEYDHKVYPIQSVPTTYFLTETGEVAGILVGARSREQLEAAIRQSLPAPNPLLAATLDDSPPVPLT